LRDDTKPAALAAVMWDLDGTLVDTEGAWTRARDDMAREHSAEWSAHDSELLVGTSLPESARGLAQRGVRLPEKVIEQELISRVLVELDQSIPWRPGARELLADLVRAGVRCALVTMAYREVATRVVAAVPGCFEVIVAGDEVLRSKPDPECYLRAADLLGTDPADCIAIEDTERGVRSALDAGYRVLAVPSSRPIEGGNGRLIRHSLAELTAHDLALMLGAPHEPVAQSGVNSR
jgi:HAD superfamily hydrolase (TIGR01509 family)